MMQGSLGILTLLGFAILVAMRGRNPQRSITDGKPMRLGRRFVLEEFTQNSQQYRWLDDTRTRFIDRFFVILLAVAGVRLVVEQVSSNRFWLAKRDPSY